MSKLQLRWEERTAFVGDRIYGYILVVETGKKYRMVFFEDGIKPREGEATSEREAKEWINGQA